jgi:transposase InsO family protein
MFKRRPQRFGAAVIPTDPGGTHRSTQAGICERLRRRPCGCQYTSEQLARFAREHNLVRSVGRMAMCWDNAQAESFWATMKVELYDKP